jgi:hypothetical protein
MNDYVLASLKTLSVWQFYPSMQRAQDALPAVLTQQPGSEYVAMSWEAFTEARDKRLLAGPLVEISRGDYERARDVLPPHKWTTAFRLDRFFLGEPLSGGFYHDYAAFRFFDHVNHHHGLTKAGCHRYFTRISCAHRQPTWITTEECQAYHDANPSGPGFDAGLVRLVRKRFSTTQGEVEVFYGDKRLEQYGDHIEMCDTPAPGAVLIGGYAGIGDRYWQDVARFKVQHDAETTLTTEAA